MNKRKQVKQLKIIGSILVILMLIFIFSDKLVTNEPNFTDLKVASLPPSSKYFFGTDAYGRCVFSRVLVGAKMSVYASLILVFISMIIGSSIGIVSGYFGGAVDQLFMRINDIILAFPSIILAIAIAGVLGGGVFNAGIALLFTGWSAYSRLIRGSVIQIKEEAYIQAAKMSGAGNLEIILHHILPNILGLIIVTASLQISAMIVGFAGLSFLGLGAQPPTAEWGFMISDGIKYVQLSPWTVLMPAITMIFTISMFNLFGDILRDYAANTNAGTD